MSEIEFRCPKCQSSLAVDTEAAGLDLDCPDCQTIITVPLHSSNQRKCPSCQTLMDATAVLCMSCDTVSIQPFAKTPAQQQKKKFKFKK